MQTEHIDIKRINLTPIQRNYLQHKLCFKQCITNNNFNDSNLTPEQKICAKNCLNKFKQMEGFMVEKIHYTMQQLILSDPNLKQAYLTSKSNLNQQ